MKPQTFICYLLDKNRDEKVILCKNMEDFIIFLQHFDKSIWTLDKVSVVNNIISLDIDEVLEKNHDLEKGDIQ